MSNANIKLFNNMNAGKSFANGKMYTLNKSKGIKVGNTIISGGGANTLQNRGANQTAAYYSTNPYFRNDFYSRWQEYVRMYYTAWEVQKIVDIVPNDAFRIPCEFVGLEEEDKEKFEHAWRDWNIDAKFKNMVTQERLLGGCVGLMGIKSDTDDPSVPLNLDSVDVGDLAFLNVVPVNQISMAQFNNDPFDKDFNSPESYMINGTEVHKSRLLIFDGNPLFNRTTANILQNFRYNPAGFGESVIAPLYDAFVREMGTQQAAYHLVNMASVLLVKGNGARIMKATTGGSSYKAMEEICEQISIYRGAVIDGKDIEITQHDASFGSVPELLMTYLQVLSAGSDIPAVRFLGEAPGGLNSSGTADLENYYNNVAAMQQQRIKPRQMKFSQVFGRSVFGKEKWSSISKKFDIKYKPLWNLSAEQQANIDSTYSNMLDSSVQAGTLTAEFANREKKARGIFVTDMNPESDTPDMIIEDGKASDPDVILDELEAKIDPKEEIIDTDSNKMS